jgi:hypothetical protein
MAQYTINTPQGPLVVNGPEGATQDEIFSAAKQLLVDRQESEATSLANAPLDYTVGEAASKALTRGFKQTGSAIFDTLPALVGSAVGADDYAKRQLQEAAQTQKEIQESYAPEVKSYKEATTPGKMGTYALESFLEQVPNVLTSIIPGVGGAGLAARAGLSKAAGAGAGLYLGSYAQNAPEVFQNIFESTGKLEPGAAALAGTLSAALDTALPGYLLKKFTGPSKALFVERLLEKSGMQPGLARKAISILPEAAGLEGLTEGAQESISIAAEKYIANNKDKFTSEDWNRIIESGIRGSISGLGFGLPGAVASRVQERREEKAALPTATPAAEPAPTTPESDIVGIKKEAPIDRTITPPVSAVDEARDRELAEVPARPASEQFPGGVEEDLGAGAPGPTVAPAEPIGREEQQPAPLEESKTTFTTERGSVYNLFGDNTSIRNRSGKDHIDTSTGLQPRSGKTIFLGSEDLNNFGAFQNPDIPTQIIPEGNEAVLLVSEDYAGYKKGQVLARAPFSLNPEVGLHPVEIYDSKSPLGSAGEGVHFGTKITGIQKQPSVTPEQQAFKEVEPKITDPIVVDARNNWETISPIKWDKLSAQDQNMLVDAYKNNAITPELAEEIKAAHPAFLQDADSRPTEASPDTNNTRNLDVKNVELFNSLAKANTLKDALTAIKTDLGSKLDEPQKILINRLSNIKKAANAKFVMFDKRLSEITDKPKDADTVGLYNFNLHRVAGFINSNISDILHEGIHAATHQEIDRHIEFTPNDRTNNEFLRKALPVIHKSKSKLGNELIKIYDRAVETSFERAKAARKPGETGFEWTSRYGFTDMHEFIAEAFTNKSFQEYLGTIPSVTKNKTKSLWDDFIKTVREMLGLPPSTETLLDDIITVSEPLFKGKRGTLDQFIDKVRGRDTELRSEQGEIKPITIVDKGNAIRIVNSMGDTIKNLPGGSQEIYEGARNALSKVPMGAKKVALAFMSLPNKIDLYGTRLPQLKTLLNNLEQRASKADQLRSEVDRLVFKGVDIIKKHPKSVVDKFNRTTLQLSAENIDPRKKYKDGTTNPDYDPNNALVKAYESLPKDLYDLGIEYTEQYEKYSLDMLEIIKDILGVKEKNNKIGIALSQRFESKRLKFYHPLRRKGDYWLSYNDKNGELIVISRGSPREIEEAMKLATQQGADPQSLKRYNKLQDINYKNAPPVGFVKDVINVLDDKLKNTLLTAEAKDGIKNQVYQTYLDLLPAEALRQQFRHREGIPGYIEDVVGGYADTGAKLANQLANMEYRIKIDTDLADMKVRLEELQGAADSEELTAVVQDIYKQKQFLDNPIADNLSSRLSWVSYMWNIAGNVSSALVNMTQIPMVVFPMLAGKYGYANAMKVLSDAYGTYRQGGFDDNRQFMPDYTFGKNAKLSPGHRRLYEAAVKQAAIRRGIGYELSEMRNTTAEDFTGKWSKTNTILGYVFQNSERMNREVTLLAAYDLAIQNGVPEEMAINQALDLTVRAHSHALSEAGPEMFQTGIGKVAFTFKRFAQAQIYNMARLFYQSVKKFNPDDETRKLAQKQLTGILGMTYVFSGAQGLPLYGAANMFTSALSSMFGDDDEPYDFDESVRSAIGDLGYKGPVNALTNVDIASRTGFNGMVWRDDPRRLSEVGFTSYFAEHFFGPAFQVGVNVERGAKLLNEGHSYRALETVVPSFAKNPLKAFRFATEGATTTNGAPIVDDVNAMSAFLQIFGFSNAELTEAYARASSMKTAEQKIQARRTALLDLHFLAKSNGDFEMMSELRDKIADYNESHPSYRISGDTLSRSYRGHMQRINDSVDGVYLNKKLKRKLIDEYGE